MLTVAELQKKAHAELSIIPMEASERHAETELILFHLTGLSLSQRMREPGRELDAEVLGRLSEITARRKNREPIQYCLGQAYFYGHEFMVRPGVLIPRADTETLVEVSNKFIEQMRVQSPARPLNDSPADLRSRLRIGEIGIGSGIISISLLLLQPEIAASACDVSAEAVSVAEENAHRHGVQDRLQVCKSDWKDWLKEKGKTLDLLLSNPPYVSLKQKQELAPEVRDWEPELALFGGEDGLDFYRELAANADQSLSGRAPIFLEIGFGQEEFIRDIFAKYDWHQSAVHKDLSGISRVLCFVRK